MLKDKADLLTSPYKNSPYLLLDKISSGRDLSSSPYSLFLHDGAALDPPAFSLRRFQLRR